MPRKNNIEKNSTAQRFGNGNIAIASGYVTKAKAGPPVATCSTDMPLLTDINPRMENTTNPAKILVEQFIIGIIIASL